VSLNVLVTAAGSTIGQGILKAIRRSSLACRIVTTDASPYSAGLYRGDTAYLVPLGKSPEFIDAIVGICRREQIQTICIGTDYELLPFAENCERIEQATGAKVIVSSPETIRVCDDKWLTHQFLRSHGFPAIPSALVRDVDILVENEGFPLIVKPRIGDSSRDTFVVFDRQSLDEQLERLERKPGTNEFLAGQTDFLVQKYMGEESDEFTSTTMTFEGKVYGVISLRREMRFGGHTAKAVVEPCQPLDDVIRRIAETLLPVGPCNFQSRMVKGVPYVFEINCRFSGTTATCAQVGFNHVEACLRRVVLREEIPPLSFKSGVMLRYFNEVIVPLGDIQTMLRDGRVEHPNGEHNTYF
jgi:carbamoyl-phosphate synthase large subunit